jgi:hypothetical protein
MMSLQAVQCVEQEVLWDAPDIRLTNKDHLRMATYIFKVPTVETSASCCQHSALQTCMSL